MLSIFKHTPPWVWGVFLYLLAQGLRQMRERSVSTRRAVIFPLLMMLWSASSMILSPAAWTQANSVWLAGFGAGLGVCLALGYPRGMALESDGESIRVAGSFWPLVLMMLVFLTHFLEGFLRTQMPALAAAPAASTGFGLVYGLTGGIFFSRVVAMFRLTRRAGRAHTLNSQSA